MKDEAKAKKVRSYIADSGQKRMLIEFACGNLSSVTNLSKGSRSFEVHNDSISITVMQIRTRFPSFILRVLISSFTLTLTADATPFARIK